MSYLATRVNKCTMNDHHKLDRLIKYVRGTKEGRIVFRSVSAGLEVSVLIDAAYRMHEGGKSHMGSCVVI